jgi:hydroxymethylpyrimidine pyrophosphatase-like HAD family hydrolase
MKPVMFTDLDDTLFYSQRALSGQDNLTLASLDRQGRGLCFHTPEQRWLVGLLIQFDIVIPVTGRSSESLARVISPQFTSYRVASHGAVILDPQGQPVSDWFMQIEEESKQWGERLDCTFDLLVQWQHQYPKDLRVRKVMDQGIITYLSVKGSEEILTDIASSFENRWHEGVLHHNQRNLALLPSYTDKARAVSYLIEHLRRAYTEPLLFMGAGDSVTDIPFLKLCDFVLTPKTSRIHKVLWP